MISSDYVAPKQDYGGWTYIGGLVQERRNSSALASFLH